MTATITKISEQINLLALNATIEAARAGDPGKGIAVVANEIKDLAKQTAEATLQIRNQIEGIQDSTVSTITEIREVTAVINNVNVIKSPIFNSDGFYFGMIPLLYSYQGAVSLSQDLFFDFPS